MSENVETAYLEESDPNFDSELQILIHRDMENIIERVKNLSEKLEDKSFSSNFRLDNNLEAIFFSQHLYQPLLYINQSDYKNPETGEFMVEIRPVALNVGEKKFVEDLKKYYTDNPSSFDGVELYLLRNKSRKVLASLRQIISIRISSYGLSRESSSTLLSWTLRVSVIFRDLAILRLHCTTLFEKKLSLA